MCEGKMKTKYSDEWENQERDGEWEGIKRSRGEEWSWWWGGEEEEEERIHDIEIFSALRANWWIPLTKGQ